MSSKLSKNQLEKFSRQIILKDIGILGQKKILNSRVLIIGMGGLGCPVAEFLTRSGVGSLGIVDHDIVGLSNIHRQTLYDEKDLGKLKVKAAKKKLVGINSKTKINIHNFKLDKKKFIKIIKKYDYIIDGSDNFETKFLINDISLKYKKFLVTGAISKFDGHIFTFDFNNKIIKIKRDENNFPIVRFSLFEKQNIIPGDVIVSFNKINLSLLLFQTHQ